MMSHDRAQVRRRWCRSRGSRCRGRCPAASAGAPSNASATNTRRAAVSYDRRTPKPALEPGGVEGILLGDRGQIGEEAVAALRPRGGGQRVDIVVDASHRAPDRGSPAASRGTDTIRAAAPPPSPAARAASRSQASCRSPPPPPAAGGRRRPPPPPPQARQHREHAQERAEPLPLHSSFSAHASIA